MTQMISDETINKALCSGNGYAQGKPLTLVIGSPLHRALMTEALVTVAGNLTRKGSIAAQRARREQEDRMFPL